MASNAQSFQYVTEDSINNLSALPSAFSVLTNYVLAPDLQSLYLSGNGITGTATMQFSSVAGIYNIGLTYVKEGNKTSSFKLVIDGIQVGSFSTLPGSGIATYIFSTIGLEQGSAISVIGTSNNGSKAEFKNLSFGTVSSLSIMAGDFSALSGYIQDGSGGIKLAGLAGSASTKFAYPSGVYDIEVVYVTETSGTPTVSLSINVSTILVWPYETGAATRSIFKQSVPINRGDTVKFLGSRSGGATARIKQIIFRPTETSNVGARLAEGLTYYAAIKVFDGIGWSNWYATRFAMSGTAWNAVSNAKGWTIEARLKVGMPQAILT